MAGIITITIIITTIISGAGPLLRAMDRRHHSSLMTASTMITTASGAAPIAMQSAPRNVFSPRHTAAELAGAPTCGKRFISFGPLVAHKIPPSCTRRRCAGVKGLVEARTAQATKARRADAKGKLASARRRRHLHSCVEKLRQALASLPAPQRRQLIEGMSAQGRLVLLRHMECSRRPSESRMEAGSPPQLSPPPPERQQRRQQQQQQQQQQQPAPQCQQQDLEVDGQMQNATKRQKTCMGWSPSRKPPQGNLWTMKVPGGVQYHAARFTVAGVTVTSKATRSRDEAQDMRRRMAMHISHIHAEQHQSFEDSFRTALSNVKADCPELQLTFAFNMDLRRWVGRRVLSPPTESVSDILALRHKLTDLVRAGSWPALRQEWLGWMCAERPRLRWKAKAASRCQAESVASAAEASHAATMAKVQLKMQQKAQVKAAAMAYKAGLAKAREEQRVRKAILNLEKALGCCNQIK